MTVTVQIPDPENLGNPRKEPWIEVATFDSLPDAIAWAKEALGADDEGRIDLVWELVPEDVGEHTGDGGGG